MNKYSKAKKPLKKAVIGKYIKKMMAGGYNNLVEAQSMGPNSSKKRKKYKNK